MIQPARIQPRIHQHVVLLVFVFLSVLVESTNQIDDIKEVPSISPLEYVQENERQCSWQLQVGSTSVQYSLKEIQDKEYDMILPSPRGAHIKLIPCGGYLQCNGAKTSSSCIHVPGLKPTSAGKTVRVDPLIDGIISSGFQLIFDEGLLCEVTNKPRKTIIKFPCDSNSKSSSSSDKFGPLKAYEGDKKFICHYYVEFPSSVYGCPLHDHHSSSLTERGNIIIEAVSGCMNSSPLKTTTNCHYNGGQTISIMGLGLFNLCLSPSSDPNKDKRLQVTGKQLSDCTRYMFEENNYQIITGSYVCTDPYYTSLYSINCTLGAGKGEELDVKLVHCNDGSCDVVAVLSGGLSYRHVINYKDMFSQFVKYGVGGLKKEIEELYRRAFASRDAAPELVTQLGITHIKGILLYGPPGAGKTLLARTVAHMLGSKQVQLINGPEIISKFLGESERNLRQYFQEATNAYKEHGDTSELFVIIIDEIEAICKPRGKSDQSSAGVAYDSLVNQLLTLMDGLSEINNILVIGMTNRKELMDPALLRPGRFEVQIDVGLPDKEGREEIFEIHTRSMRNSGSISSDVNTKELAANTTRFSGAEIAGVVRAAASYALERQTLAASQDQSFMITRDDFRRALLSVTPAYTHSESHILSQYLPQVYLPLTSQHDNIVGSLISLINTLSPRRLKTALIYGSKGTGKTTLAARISILGHFSYVKIVTASDLIGLSDFGKIDFIRQVFKDAYSSDKSLIVLDDLHRLVEYVQIGGRVSVSHSMMHVLSTLLTTSGEGLSSVLLVIGTLTTTGGGGTLLNADSTENLNFPSLFTWHYHIPLLNSTSILSFLRMSHINRLKGGEFSIPNHLKVSMSDLLTAIECACISEGSLNKSCFRHSHLSQSHLLDCLMNTKDQSSTVTLPLMKEI